MKYSANVNRSAGQVMRKFLLAWLISVTIEYCVLPAALRDLNNLDGLAKMSLPRVCALTFGVTLLLMILPCRRPIEKAERWAIMAAFSLLAMTALQASFTWSFFIACILLFSILCFYALFGRNDRPAADHKSVPGKKQHILIGTLLSILFFLFVSTWTIGRICSFSTPTFDLGIFSQMFYNLKTSGLPMTTVERDLLLSHFAVHVSPIYYLLLPFYRLAPTPATLQVLQAAVITSSVLPLWKIGKHHGLIARSGCLYVPLYFCSRHTQEEPPMTFTKTVFLHHCFCGYSMALSNENPLSQAFPRFLR